MFVLLVAHRLFSSLPVNSRKYTLPCSVLLLIAIGVPEVMGGDDPERQEVVVVVGAAGSEEYASMFQSWAERWETAAKSADAGFVAIGLDNAPSDDNALSDKNALSQTIEKLTADPSREPLWIILIGHGTFDGRTARFNLRGPDITANATAALLNSKRPIALINCSSSSAPFINAVSGSNRVVLTATKDGGQFQVARFGEALSAAIAGQVADLNRDGQVSLLEAWVLAARRTEEFYKSNGRLATEHSLLDDNGDGLGSRVSAYEGGQLRVADENTDADGSLARRWHLIRSDEERRLSGQQRERRDELEKRLEEIKRQPEDHTDFDHLNQLESVLLPLAQLYQEIAAGESETKKPSEDAANSEKTHN